jgi:hypothetical protein
MIHLRHLVAKRAIFTLYRKVCIQETSKDCHLFVSFPKRNKKSLTFRRMLISHSSDNNNAEYYKLSHKRPAQKCICGIRDRISLEVKNRFFNGPGSPINWTNRLFVMFSEIALLFLMNF